MDYDDFDNGDDWGYDGDPEHDMWVDYTTDMYEGSDYSGENPDHDVDWDAEYEANVDYHHGPVRHYGNGDTHRHTPQAASMSEQQYEHRIHQLETLIAAALASAATLDAKSANATTPKEIWKYQQRAGRKQSEARKYREELDRLTTDRKTARRNAEANRTDTILWICIAISVVAVLIALLY